MFLLTITVFYLFLFFHLKNIYPIELTNEILRFCDDDGTNSPKKDYLWIFKFKSLNLNIYDAFYGVLFLTISYLISLKYTQLSFVYLQTLLFILLLSSAIDLKVRMMPDSVHVIIISLGLYFSPSTLGIPLIELTQGMIVGYLLMFLVFWITSTIMNKEAMGMADAKLVASLGAVLGFMNIPILLLMAGFLAAISIPFMNYTNKQYPFGPFISVSALLILFNELHLHVDLMGLIP